MKRSITLLCLALPALGCASGGGQAARAPAAPEPAEASRGSEPSDQLVLFSSPASIERLERSKHKIDFFTLANQFEGQQHGGMCGPTSAVIVLNALRADAPAATKPEDPSLFPEKYRSKLPPGFDPLFHRYTQGAFFDDERVSGVKSEDQFYGVPATPGGKRDPGMQLRQLHQILLALGVESKIRVVDDDLGADVIRRELIDNLSRAGDYVIVNYYRPVLDQKGGGHISPLGAYDERSDSFLVLDVNPNRGKRWAWVPAERLIAAMRTFDTVENRGYLLVRDRDRDRDAAGNDE